MIRFTSFLARRMESFVTLKRATGASYEHGEQRLHLFDRYVAALDPPPEFVTQELVLGWLASRPGISPHTLLNRASVIRQFCLYLARTEPRTYVPDRSIMPRSLPRRHPHIYSEGEVRALLRAARTLTRYETRTEGVAAMVLVAYTTGLRCGEICRLRVADVDLDARTFFIDETKFCKSRIAPFSDGLARELRAYFELRRRYAPHGSDAPFFVNRHRRAFGRQSLTKVFHDLVGLAGVSSAPAHRRPRFHDMRHTFAVHRLLRWYRDGVDVEAKLPLLSTYMGHVDVFSTQVYLTATSELLREASGRFERAYGPLVTSLEGMGDDAR
jgi:integrase/recombinase XerD